MSIVGPAGTSPAVRQARSSAEDGAFATREAARSHSAGLCSQARRARVGALPCRGGRGSERGLQHSSHEHSFTYPWQVSARFRGETPRIIAILNANSSVICGVGRATTRLICLRSGRRGDRPSGPGEHSGRGGSRGGRKRARSTASASATGGTATARSSFIFLDRPNDVTIHITEVTTTDENREHSGRPTFRHDSPRSGSRSGIGSGL